MNPSSRIGMYPNAMFVLSQGLNGTLTGGRAAMREFTSRLRGLPGGSFAHMNDDDVCRVVSGFVCSISFLRV